MTYGVQFSRIESYCLYFGCLFFAIFFAYLSEKYAKTDIRGNYQVNKIFWILSFLFLFTPVAFRGYGVDHAQYIIAYYQIKSFGWSYFEHYNFFPEPLYALLNYLVANIIHNVQFIFIFSAFIPLCTIYLHFSRYVKKISLVMCIFSFGFSYYFFMFGLVRISIAVGIITYAYQYIENNNFLKYLFFVIIASLFHYSAFIMLPIYFFVNFSFENKKSYQDRFYFLKYCFLSLLAIFITIYLIKMLFPILFGSFPWFTRYLMYFNLKPNWRIINNTAFIVPILIIGIIWEKQICNVVYHGKLYIKLLIIMLFLSISSIYFPIHRVSYYFIPASIYLYSSVKKLPFTKFNKLEVLIIYNFSIFIIGIIWIYISIFKNPVWEPFLLPYYFNFPL